MKGDDQGRILVLQGPGSQRLARPVRAAAQRNISHSAAELQGIPGLISKCEAALYCRIPVFTVHVPG